MLAIQAPRIIEIILGNYLNSKQGTLLNTRSRLRVTTSTKRKTICLNCAFYQRPIRTDHFWLPWATETTVIKGTITALTAINRFFALQFNHFQSKCKVWGKEHSDRCSMKRDRVQKCAYTFWLGFLSPWVHVHVPFSTKGSRCITLAHKSHFQTKHVNVDNLYPLQNLLPSCEISNCMDSYWND